MNLPRQVAGGYNSGRKGGRIMPLRDHFHPPLSDRRQWESFHAAWATEIMGMLNRRVLPANCFAQAQVHIGGRVEIDVATLTLEGDRPSPAPDSNGGVAVETWAPPAVDVVMPAVFPDEIEIQVFRTSGGATLVGAIELVSPRNKDRGEARRAFAAKCASYLQQGVGLVVVDVVTERRANLHDELVHLLGHPEAFAFPPNTFLCALAYRPRRQKSGDTIETWRFPLELGRLLPTVPLALRDVATLPLDLETTYTTTCQNNRL
jgi:hypothetical protein